MIAFSWSEYVRAITVHSSNALLEDTIEELTILMQTDTSMEYCRWFDVLLNKVIICEEYTISICLRDLKNRIEVLGEYVLTKDFAWYTFFGHTARDYQLSFVFCTEAE